MNIDAALILAFASLIGSGVAIYTAIRKTPAEVRNTDASASEASAAAVQIYADEIVKLKECQNKYDKERKAYQEKTDQEFRELRLMIHQRDLLLKEWEAGITLLISQLTAQGDEPIWRPSAKPAWFMDKRDAY